MSVVWLFRLSRVLLLKRNLVPRACSFFVGDGRKKTPIRKALGKALNTFES